MRLFPLLFVSFFISTTSLAQNSWRVDSDNSKEGWSFDAKEIGNSRSLKIDKIYQAIALDERRIALWAGDVVGGNSDERAIYVVIDSDGEVISQTDYHGWHRPENYSLVWTKSKKHLLAVDYFYGSLIRIDPDSGEILGAVTSPGFECGSYLRSFEVVSSDRIGVDIGNESYCADISNGRFVKAGIKGSNESTASLGSRMLKCSNGECIYLDKRKSRITTGHWNWESTTPHFEVTSKINYPLVTGTNASTFIEIKGKPYLVVISSNKEEVELELKKKWSLIDAELRKKSPIKGLNTKFRSIVVPKEILRIVDEHRFQIKKRPINRKVAVQEAVKSSYESELRKQVAAEFQKKYGRKRPIAEESEIQTKVLFFDLSQSNANLVATFEYKGEIYSVSADSSGKLFVRAYSGSKKPNTQFQKVEGLTKLGIVANDISFDRLAESSLGLGLWERNRNGAGKLIVGSDRPGVWSNRKLEVDRVESKEEGKSLLAELRFTQKGQSSPFLTLVGPRLNSRYGSDLPSPIAAFGDGGVLMSDYSVSSIILIKPIAPKSGK